MDKDSDAFKKSLECLTDSQEYYLKYALEIKDQGVGISKENLGKIFIDFGKLDEHQKMNPTGTGLGLSICKMIVEKMRGNINVQSKLNKGTTFSVIIRSKVII